MWQIFKVRRRFFATVAKNHLVRNELFYLPIWYSVPRIPPYKEKKKKKKQSFFCYTSAQGKKNLFERKN